MPDGDPKLNEVEIEEIRKTEGGKQTQKNRNARGMLR